MSEICLENFLSNIHPFLEQDSRDEFLQALKEVPNVDSVFQDLIQNDPAWLEQAQKSANGVCFLLEKSTNKTYYGLSNKLQLCHFCMDAFPTIKVTKYVRPDLIITTKYR